MKIVFGFCLIFLLISNPLSGQERIFKLFNTKDGLPTNNIFKIRFDQRGFLWIAHDKGISRFDGNSFKNYTHPNQKSNVFTDVYIAPDGRVWMTNLGLQAFYIENDKMILFRSFDLKYPAATLKIGFLNNGNMVFNANGGLLEISAGGKELAHYNYKAPIQSFYCTGDEVYFNIPNTSILSRYVNRRVSQYGFSTLYPPIYLKDSVLISTFNVSRKLDILNIRTGKSIGSYELGNTYNYGEMINGDFYAFSNSNMHKITVEGEKITGEIVADGRSYTHYAIDKLGNQWYSTLNEGILFIPKGNTQKLGNGDAHAWVKVDQFRGLVYALSDKNRFFRVGRNNAEMLADFDTSLNQKPVILSKNLNDRYMVIGNSRFIILDSNLKMRPYFPLIAMKDICLDKNNNAYLATSGGAHSHSFDKELLSRLFDVFELNNIRQIKTYPLSGRYTCIAYDDLSETVYIGGVPGLYSQKKGQAFTEIKDSLNSIYPSVLYRHGQYLLTGTIHTGLYVLRDGKIASHFNSDNSSIGNNITKIIGYENMVWILSENGLHSYYPGSEFINTYTQTGAINLKNCSDFTIADNQLYIISAQEMYTVGLLEFMKSLTQVPVFFVSLQTGNREIILPEGDIRLAYNENSIAVDFDIPAASVLGNAEFEYSLDGENWVVLGKTQRRINLSQLSSGNYTLRLRQKGMKNVYALQFSIAAPFWKSWWFISLLIFSAAAFIFVVYRIRIKTISDKSHSEIEKFKLEKALQQNILSSIKSQMNPHFIFNALNTIQSYIYLNDKKQAIAYLGKFSELTRKILEQSNFETITLTEEHETLELYLQLEKMRFENTLDYRFVFKGIAFKDHISIPPMLIQPYVENAVKHGLLHKPDMRFVEITFQYNETQNMLQVFIDDNGIGRKRSEEINRKMQKHKSFSTQANRTRLEILNKDNKNPISLKITDKTDEFGNASGTLVQINIPVL